MKNARLMLPLSLLLIFGIDGCRQQPVLETPSLPVSAGLLAGEKSCTERKEKDCTWKASSEMQQRFLDHLEASRTLLAEPFPGLTSIAAPNAEEVNTFLAKAGIPITLPSVGNNGLAMAAVLSLHGAWGLGGEETTLMVKGGTYPAAELKGGFKAYTWRTYSGVAIVTQEEEIVHLIPMKKGEVAEFLRGFQTVFAKWNWKSQGELKVLDKYNRLIFPFVDHEVVTDLEELVGMRLGPFRLEVAKMSKSIKMDELGFISKTGFAAGATRGAEPPRNPFVIDREFLFLVQRPGVSFPLEAEWIPKSSWKDPGDLSLQ
jgi:hypothetical protein